MLLLQFSTSHYCRKVRLALGYKKISFAVENLTPGAHLLRVKPLTGLNTVPVLLPQQAGEPEAIADSTAIFHYLEQICPEPSWQCGESHTLQTQVNLLEDWLDESIGTATRFVYYHFRAGAGKSIDPSLASQMVIQVVRWQYGITETAVKQAQCRLEQAMVILGHWQDQPYLVGNQLTLADLTAAALLSPLALIPEYRQSYPWLFHRIGEIHHQCGEPLPPGLS
ncbi:glutathione S-transferase [Spirulina subsalsa FACHB-351]|uniref:Glutathione S-transferase n=1 Tax=Spirulina subsalsa FACHB-351 TaxID=234711 RepID=A0ABT3L4M7_9CYAN|nr:glutathione S-transferase [Spirulina subsalsa]MCW6035935.1 glutathione S-transferase [Spirulina subsalsa FACHB-351]